MARGEGTVTVKFLGDASQLKKVSEDAEGVLGKVGSSFGNVAKSAAMVAGPALLAFGAAAVKLGSDVNESLSKVTTVFGKNATEIDKWAKGGAEDFGLSRQAALDAAGSFGNMFTQLGIGTKEAAKMSTGMIELAADFASFHNADISEVIDAQSAAFRGEYDSLQRFLPLINATTVEQKALEMTGKATTKELTAQEKALAVNALMMAGAGEAAGDFDRTSGGLANQMRILKAQGENLMASVGEKLLPVVLRGITMFRELAGELKDRLGPAVEGLQRIWGSFHEALQGAGTNTSDNPIVRFAGDAGNFMSEFSAKVQEVWANVVGWFEENRGKIQEILTQLGETFSSAFEAIKTIVVTAIDFLKGVWRVFGDDIVSFVREAIASIMEAFRGITNTLEGIFDLIKAVLTGRWGDAWEAVKQILDGVWDTIFALVRHAVTNVIPTIIAGLGQILVSIGRTLFDGVKDGFRGAINWIIDRWNGLEFKMPGVKTPLGDIGGFTIGVPDIPRLATGGRFSGAAIVGERGPELLVGSRSGHIVPNNRLGGMTVNVNFNTPMDAVAAGREIEKVLTRFVQAGGNLRFT